MHASHGADMLSLAGEGGPGEGGPGEGFDLHCASSSTILWGLLCLCGQLPLTHRARELLLEHEHAVEMCLWHPLAPARRKHSSHFTATYGRKYHAVRTLKKTHWGQNRYERNMWEYSHTLV